MNAIDFEERNVEIAKEQEEYATLPAYAQHEGIVTYCMQLNEEEVKKVTSKKTAYIRFLNFGTPVQPVAFSIRKPKLPIDYRSKTESTLFGWQPVEEGASSPQYAVFKFNLKADEVALLKDSKCIWVTVVTFNKPLQPISTELG